MLAVAEGTLFDRLRGALAIAAVVNDVKVPAREPEKVMDGVSQPKPDAQARSAAKLSAILEAGA